MNGIELKLIWADPYSEEFLIKVGNGLNYGSLEFYTTQEQIIEFGNQLINFPKNIDEKVIFTSGKISQSSYFIELEVFCFNQFGHGAIKVHLQNDKGIPESYELIFYISCEVASINELGNMLLKWDIEDILNWYPTKL